MKIAVIGGNLLGCATALNLALVHEHDERTFTPSPPRFQITLFERLPRLGGHSLTSIPIDDDLHVETGTYRTLPLIQGTYLTDLVSAANGERGHMLLLGRRLRIPGATAVSRGQPGAATVARPWLSGSYGCVMRSFAAWDWRQDDYSLIHRGWSILDLAYRLFHNNIWRSAALALFLWSVRHLQSLDDMVSRAMALAQVGVAFFVLVLSPRRVAAIWQRQYTFWATTIPLLISYGITPAISRGSTIGFVKQLSDMNVKNVATCAVSVGTLISRAGLDAYVRGTGADYVRMFKYDPIFVNRYIAPIIAWQYAGAQLADVNSFASHFAMLDADFTNSDVDSRLSQISPNNATLCTALLDAAKADTDLDLKLNSLVSAIAYNETSQKYTVTYGSGQSDLFDGVVLCASPANDELVIDTPRSSSISELLGYDRDVLAAERHAQQQADFLTEQAESDPAASTSATERGVTPETCSHFAVVVGVANFAFFRFSAEKLIPDLVQVTHAPGFSRFERIREPQGDKPGVYTVLCGADFQSSGLFSEMFEDDAELRYYAPVRKSIYSHSALPSDMDMDDCTPYVVLGNRFVYAAATDKLARHPEMDAISAVNAASLFSHAVKWSVADEKDDEGEEDGDAGDDAREAGEADCDGSNS